MKKTKGFTLIEVLVSFAMLAVIAAAIFPIVGWLVSKSSHYKFDSEAAEVLQEGMEASYNIMLASNDWSLLPSGNFNQTPIDLHVEQVAGVGDSYEWTFGLDKVTVNAQFERWTTISPVCRDAVSGERIDCVSADTVDLNSRLITTFVTWIENGETKLVKSELLVVKI